MAKTLLSRRRRFKFELLEPRLALDAGGCEESVGAPEGDVVEGDDSGGESEAGVIDEIIEVEILDFGVEEDVPGGGDENASGVDEAGADEEDVGDGEVVGADGEIIDSEEEGQSGDEEAIELAEGDDAEQIENDDVDDGEGVEVEYVEVLYFASDDNSVEGAEPADVGAGDAESEDQDQAGNDGEIVVEASIDDPPLNEPLNEPSNETDDQVEEPPADEPVTIDLDASTDETDSPGAWAEENDAVLVESDSATTIAPETIVDPETVALLAPSNSESPILTPPQTPTAGDAAPRFDGLRFVARPLEAIQNVEPFVALPAGPIPLNRSRSITVPLNQPEHPADTVASFAEAVDALLGASPIAISPLEKLAVVRGRI